MNYWINVTKDCNLKCTYCYQKDYHQSVYMDQHVADQVVGFILREDPESSAINFFGGEALLNFKIIRYIVEKLAGHGGFSFSMTTNLIGLTEEMASFFDRHHFSLLVSFDGTRASQDLGRMTRKGTGTYDLVLDRLKKLQQYSGVQVRIAKVLSMENFPNFYQDYLFLKELGYKVLVNTLLDGMVLDEETDLELYREQVYKVFADCLENDCLSQFPAFQKFYHRYQRLSYAGTIDAESPELICTQPENAQLVFDCEGQIHPCHMMVELELPQTGLPLCNCKAPSQHREELFQLNPKFKPFTSEEIFTQTEQMIQMKDCNQCRYLHSCLDYFLARAKTSCVLKRYRRRVSEVEEGRTLLCFSKLVLDVLDQLLESPLQNLQIGGRGQ